MKAYPFLQIVLISLPAPLLVNLAPNYGVKRQKLTEKQMLYTKTVASLSYCSSFLKEDIK